MSEPILSKAYVLAPSWNSLELTVQSSFRDAGASDPLKRIIVPAGVWVCHVNDETRFSITPVLVRAGREREYDSILTAASFPLQTSTDAEMYFRVSGGTPNTNDASTTQVGVVLTRMGGSET